jgi:hypothetical protein
MKKFAKERRKPLTPFMNVKPGIPYPLDRFLMVSTIDLHTLHVKMIQITSRLEVNLNHSSWSG